MAPFSGKKVLIVTPEYPPLDWGGLARTVERIAAYSVEFGFEVHVARLKVADTPVVFLDDNRTTEQLGPVTLHSITVGRENMNGADRSIWDCPHTLTLRMMYASLHKLQEEIGADVFNSFFLYPVAYPAVLLARRLGLPVSVMLLGNDIRKYTFSPEKAGVCAVGLKWADSVVSLAEDMLDMADALEPVRHKARVIYAAVKIPDKAWQPEPTNGRPLKIGCAGIFKYAKGLPYLFQAVARLRKKLDVHLELLGVLRPDEEQVFQAALERSGIGDILTFKGAIDHAEVPAWLRSLDVYTLPSLSEGCPHILQEALAAGVPSVASRIGATDAIIENGVSGLLVPWADPESLARALETALTDRDRAAALGAAGRQRMIDRFNFEEEKQGWRQVYQDLMGD